MKQNKTIKHNEPKLNSITIKLNKMKQVTKQQSTVKLNKTKLNKQNSKIKLNCTKINNSTTKLNNAAQLN